jgi:gamma-glutamylcyclotransferase (GGCT)/AIG2-like uncharacterized protein YtfP
MTARVFAFGSNMCSGRFRDHGVHPAGVGEAASLQDHRLAFEKLSKKDGSGKASVQPAAGEVVWGVLYEIPDAELPILDRGEGKGYTRSHLRVTTGSGQSVDAWVYVAREPDTSGKLKPYTWYTRFLVEGAIEHRLPDEYVRTLRALAADPDPDQARDTERRALSCGE